eukprot:6131-Heterococcus_DN1.PRE.2
MYVCATIAIIIVSCHNIAPVCAAVAALAVFTKLNAAASLAISYYYCYYCCCLPRYSIGVHNATTQGNRSMRTIATTIAYSLSSHCVLLQHAFIMIFLRAAAEHERFTHYLRMQTIVTENCMCLLKDSADLQLDAADKSRHTLQAQLITATDLLAEKCVS